MIACLDTLVLLREACENASPNACYINDLPGYPEKAFELVTNKGDKTGEAIWSKIKRRASKTLIADFEAQMSGKFESRTIVENIHTGVWSQPFQSLPSEAKYTGEYINLTGSQNLIVYIEKAQIYTQGAVSDYLYVFDLETGKNIDTIPFASTEAGFLDVEINKTYGYRKLLIAYDKSAVQSRRVDEYGYDYYSDMCTPCKCTASTGRAVSVDLSEDVIYRNLDYVSDSGLIVNYSIQCGLSNWICKNANRVSDVFQLLLGLELATEIAASDRVNEATLSDSVDAFAEYCTKGYSKRLKNLVKGVKITDSVCMPCKSSIRKVGIHP